jgi:hypothetical protein
MKLWLSSCALALAAQTCVLVTPAGAVAPVHVVFGTSWDGPSKTLQKIVDGLYGVGAINVTTDYEGAKTGDPDPWFWFGSQFSALLIREVAGNADRNTLGWYLETGSIPVITSDGVHDGVVFDGPASAGATRLVTFPTTTTRFGFYLNPNGPYDAVWAPEPEKFYTNRFYNDKGPNGVAVHEPFDGDVQALIFDVSRFTQPNTWLVCFEDLDSGANPAPCCYPTDNDFNDLVFEVRAFGAVPTIPMTFGALKAKYRN